MQLQSDYVVVGSGLTGATIARLLHDAGREVVVLERRSHVGGNVHDHVHPSGIRVHTYGPHYFRTDSEAIWSFVTRFSAFYPYEAIVKSYVDGDYEPWPIPATAIMRFVGPDPANFEEACLSMMPLKMYERFVKGYTEKQWGVPAHTLAPGLADRIEMRVGNDSRLTQHKYQGIPTKGYAAFMSSMLEGIPVVLAVEYLESRDQWKANRCLVFTGPIDQFFGYDLGYLTYRGQQREHVYLPDMDWAQPCGQVNNPDPANGSHIRTLEWKHMLPPEYASRIRGTVLTRETPTTPLFSDHYEYPFPDEQNANLYELYRARADSVPRTLICGRLGEYRYYDMDQAIGRAMMLATGLLEY